MKATAQFSACYCHVMNGEPHHHVDDTTVVPWDEFCRSFREYAGKIEVKGELPDPHKGISISSKPMEKT